MKRAMVIAAVLGVMATGSFGRAEEERERHGDGERGRPAEIRRELEELDRHMEKLERQRAELMEQMEALDQQEEREQWFAEVQDDSRRLLRDCDEELEFLQKEDPPRNDAGRRFRQEQIDHLRATSKIAARIIDLEPGGKAFDEMEELLRAIETLENKWVLLTEPRYGRGGEVEMIEGEARQSRDPVLLEVAAKLREVHEQDVRLGREVLALIEKRGAMAREIDKLFDAFWSRLGNLERREDEGRHDEEDENEGHHEEEEHRR